MRVGTSRITGIRAGEITLDMISGPAVVIRGKFAYLRDDGQSVGSYTKVGDWSEKTQEALVAFIQALEADVFPEVFKGQPGPAETEGDEAKLTEPKQF